MNANQTVLPLFSIPVINVPAEVKTGQCRVIRMEIKGRLPRHCADGGNKKHVFAIGKIQIRRSH